MAASSYQSPNQSVFFLKIVVKGRPAMGSRERRDAPVAMEVAAHETDAVRGGKDKNLALIELK